MQQILFLLPNQHHRKNKRKYHDIHIYTITQSSSMQRLWLLALSFVAVQLAPLFTRKRPAFSFPHAAAKCSIVSPDTAHTHIQNTLQCLMVKFYYAAAYWNLTIKHCSVF